MDHRGHIIAACARGYIRIIESLHQRLYVQLRTHQQRPYKNLGWSLLKMLDNRIIFRLHSSLEFLFVTLAYWYFSLILLLTSERKLLRNITCFGSGHTLCSSSLNHKFLLEKCFLWNQGNNLFGCQDNELFILFDAQESNNLFKIFMNDWSYHFRSTPNHSLILLYNRCRLHDSAKDWYSH